MITGNTKINLGIAGVIISTGFGVVWQAGRMNANAESRTAALEAQAHNLTETVRLLTNQIDELNNRLSSLASDCYHLSSAREAALREAIENPGHRVPDPIDPNKIIVVERRPS